ncbi:NAD(P)H-dependent glycerol-3-phosphate dehydrogenase [candidate division KSB1 bacterium]|nr:MAG: NAD(P)H-dependent glycerol-3-phosphate dehydrogenase [candidate division KSB1 bacterium]RKY87265.1 MAG: NAD(P)H-dependent glycerol-3-phosphate dehydrogenase [candidate division KSB1 bacterium]
MKIGILGAGGWGTALSILLSSNGHKVTLWEFQPNVAHVLATKRVNEPLLPGVRIPDEVEITSELEQVVENAEIIVIAVPSHVVRSLTERMRSFSLQDKLVVSVAKGLENETLKRLSEVILENLPQLNSAQIVILSGPSHAEEVSRGVPTTVVAASESLESAKKIQRIFTTSTFRVYTNIDVIGVELGGSLKNIIAIAAGISDGVGYGDNTKAALMTRGLVEITRLGVAMGANPMTFAGLSGMGDLIVTCMSRYSRNRYVGEQIGRGRKLSEVLSEMVMVAEGVRTTKSAVALAEKYHVEMPITQQVYEVLFGNKDPQVAMSELMSRDLKVEKWG